MVACNFSGVYLNRAYQRLGSRSREGSWMGRWDASYALHLTNLQKLCSLINARSGFRLKDPQKEASFWTAPWDRCQTSSLVGCWWGWLLSSFLSLGTAMANATVLLSGPVGIQGPKSCFSVELSRENWCSWLVKEHQCRALLDIAVLGKRVQGVQLAGVWPPSGPSANSSQVWWQWWLAAPCPSASPSC